MWKASVNIKQFIDDDSLLTQDDIIPNDVVDNIVQELRKIPQHIRKNSNFDSLIKSLLRIKGKKVRTFNKCLIKIYDEADITRVWLGL